MHLFFNAKIHTLQNNQVLDWLLCASGKIVATGRESDRPKLPDFAQYTDLQGQTVLPAFTDAHTHFIATALAEQRIQLDNADSLQMATEILRKESTRFKPGDWVRGGGFNKNLWQDGQPHQSVLDEIFPHNPVALESKDFHSMWLNSQGMKKVGFTRNSDDPAGGKLERDHKGQLSGMIYEKALDNVYRRLKLPAQETIEQAVDQVSRKFHSTGITTVHTMEGLAEFGAIQSMCKAGKLKLRVHFFIPKNEAKALISANIQSGFGSEMLSIAGVKFFTDGSLGSQTAHMLEPYENTSNLGIPHISSEDLNRQVAIFNKNGLSAAVHAIGDAAVLKTLDAFAFAKQQFPDTKIFNRLEHAQLVPKEQVRRFKQLQITASMQPIHIADDVLLAQKYWGQRCQRAFPIKDLNKAGVNLAFGSDTPVATFNPFEGIYSAMERKYQLNSNHKTWEAQQSISLVEALRAYTIGPALSINRDSVSGSLEAGKAADFIVLDRDIFNLPVQALLEVKVLKTVMAGHPVYQDKDSK